MNSFAYEFEQKLLAKLTEARDELDASIVAGRLATMEDYKFHTGRRQALCDAIQMCEEVASDIAKQSRL